MKLDWSDPPNKELKDALHEIVEALGDEVTDMPDMEDVIGIPIDTLTKHAVETIALTAGQLSTRASGAEAAVQVYCTGFVIGYKYAQRRAARSLGEQYE